MPEVRGLVAAFFARVWVSVGRRGGGRIALASGSGRVGVSRFPVPPRMQRREFLQATAAWAALGLPRALSAPAGSGVFKAAVIGHTGRGNYGHGLDGLFAGRPNVSVVAVADPDAAGRAAAQQRSRALRAYADYREMLEREQPDLVSVAPRWTDQHHAMVGAALRAGAHVYCEKPFTRTLAEADELVALAARTGRRIAIAHQSRVAPPILELKRRLSAGLIGELLEIRAWGKQDRRAGGEDLVVLGTHQFDLVRYFAGDPLWCSARILQGGREVTAADVRAATEDIGPVIGDEIDAVFALPAGVNLHFSSRAKSAAATGPWGMELVGTKGSVRILHDFYPQVLLRQRAGTTADDEAWAWRPIPGDATATASVAERSVTAGNRRVVDDWLAAIAEQREAACSGLSGLKSLEMIHAVFAAGLRRTRVALPLANRQHSLAG